MQWFPPLPRRDILCLRLQTSSLPFPLGQGPRLTPRPHLLCEHQQAPLASGFPLGSANRGHCRERGGRRRWRWGNLFPDSLLPGHRGQQSPSTRH